MDNSARQKLSNIFYVDDSEIADFERMIANNEPEDTISFIVEQSNLLQSTETYVAIEDHYRERNLCSSRREKAMVYLKELLELWYEGELSFPEHIAQKARFALIRGHFGRLEELGDIFMNACMSPLHILPLETVGEQTPILNAKKETASEIYQLIQGMNIAEADFHTNMN